MFRTWSFFIVTINETVNLFKKCHKSSQFIENRNMISNLKCFIGQYPDKEREMERLYRI